MYYVPCLYEKIDATLAILQEGVIADLQLQGNVTSNFRFKSDQKEIIQSSGGALRAQANVFLNLCLMCGNGGSI